MKTNIYRHVNCQCSNCMVPELSQMSCPLKEKQVANSSGESPRPTVRYATALDVWDEYLNPASLDDAIETRVNFGAWVAKRLNSGNSLTQCRANSAAERINMTKAFEEMAEAIGFLALELPKPVFDDVAKRWDALEKELRTDATPGTCAKPCAYHKPDAICVWSVDGEMGLQSMNVYCGSEVCYPHKRTCN